MVRSGAALVSLCPWVPHVGELQKHIMTVKKRDLRSVSEHVQKEAVDMSVGKQRKIHHRSIRLKIRKNWEEQGKLIGVTVDPNAKS
jgi:hypothetical protein